MLALGQKEGKMPRIKYTVEQIITKLREAEVALSKGQTVVQVCRQLSITEQTYYRWRNEYGGLKLDQAKRLKDLERENTRLKRAVADLTLVDAATAAHELGMNKSSLYRLARAGRIPSYRVGPKLGGVRFSVTEVKEALKRHPPPQSRDRKS
jgi:excisionase family DNA binding protein